MRLSARPSPSAEDPLDLEVVLEALEVIDQEIVAAGWTDGMADFQVDLRDGRTLLFLDCLQVSCQRSVTPFPLVIRGWWSDEPSAMLATLAPELRALYHQVVFDLGDATLRVVFRTIGLQLVSGD